MQTTVDPTAKLNNGVEIPRLGLGVYQSTPGQITQRAVEYALKIGYRHVDTARIYGNEADVGIALRKSGLQRDNVFITTKLWNSDQGYESALRACDESLKRLGLKYLDLYLIHWPVTELRGESWKALVRLLKDGKCRSIGVSNYTIHHLTELLGKTDVVPAVNQVEFSPFLYQKQLLEFCAKNRIQLEAYSPLTQGEKLNHPRIQKIAKNHDKSPAQVLIRWGLQHNLVTIPKSVREERIRENSQVFDFNLTSEDMGILDSLNENFRNSWDPTNMP
ncbi:MAG TPA: aldo/keto reductase [Candidatus Bathyarchaeia archaeon]|jgi:diketogulonate reductase-like aldo/keto reductase|nr:aldo/keto reductase [Candidatus Bathyarchaeia archaeon]